MADRLSEVDETEVENTVNTTEEPEPDSPDEDDEPGDDDEDGDEEDDEPEEITSDQAIQVLRGHIAELGGGDSGISERLNEINQTLYTTARMIRRAHPKVLAGVWEEIEELRRLVASLPVEKPVVKVLGFKPPVEFETEEED